MVTPGTWSPKQVRALAEFVLFHGDPVKKWPSHKRDQLYVSEVDPGTGGGILYVRGRGTCI